MSTKTQSGGSGTVTIPEAVFQTWVATFLPVGQFYGIGKVKLKPAGLEVDYNFSTETQPASPP